MADADVDTVLTKIAEHLEANPEVQSYSVDGVTVNRTDILSLLEARRRLRAEQDSASGTSPINHFRRGLVR